MGLHNKIMRGLSSKATLIPSPAHSRRVWPSWAHNLHAFAVVTWLLECGASPCVRDFHRRPAIRLAASKSVRNCYRRFRARFPERWDYRDANVRNVRAYHIIMYISHSFIHDSDFSHLQFVHAARITHSRKKYKIKCFEFSCVSKSNTLHTDTGCIDGGNGACVRSSVYVK